jgi:hypothetical protein
MAKAIRHPPDIIKELRYLRTALASALTQPPGWEHWISNVQKGILACEEELRVCAQVVSERTVMMFGANNGGQVTFEEVHPDDVAAYTAHGWQVANQVPAP